MRIITRERKNPKGESKTLYVFEFKDQDDISMFHFMLKNAITKLDTDGSKQLTDLQEKIKSRTVDKYAHGDVQFSSFLFDNEANMFTMLLLTSNSLFKPSSKTKNEEEEFSL